MTREQVEALRQSLGLSTSAFAKLIKTNRTGYWEFQTGVRDLPELAMRNAVDLAAQMKKKKGNVVAYVAKKLRDLADFVENDSLSNAIRIEELRHSIQVLSQLLPELEISMDELREASAE
jgi:hypothetical protein